MHWFTHIFAPILVTMGIVVFGSWLLLTYGGQFLGPFWRGEGSVIRIDRVPIRIDSVADTPDARFRGLSGRTSLPEGSGLLFVFEQDGYHGITMRNMRFAIDVIWISADLRVVHVERNMLPQTYPRVFEPPQPARYVIETNAHVTESFSISVGDRVEIPAQYRTD